MYPIDFFWRAADRWPQRTALDTPTGLVSYAQLAGKVSALAAAMVASNPAPQSRVGICGANSAEHVIALLATLACGKIWVPLNAKSTASEIRRITDATTPAILLLDSACTPLLEGASGRRIFMNSGIADADADTDTDTDTVGTLGAQYHAAPRPIFALPDNATQAIKFTGGTTGAPKGVMQPYRAWMASITNQIHAWHLGEDDRYVVAAPITHGTSTYILPILAQGGCHVFPDSAGLESVRRAFRERGGTISFMPPTLIYMLMALSGASRSDFAQLRHLVYGGAPMPPEKIREVRDFFGPVLCTTYGQTEAPQILTVMRPADFEDESNWASVGHVGWFSDVAIMDPERRRLAAGEVGEVVARGDLVMTGYWKLEDKTAETLIDGWLHTGDRGLIDPEGRLFLKDRLRDTVITGGFNVYPIDVENALMQHPAVHECAVFGIPDDKWGEAVHAAVQLRPDAQVDESALLAFVRDRLGPVQTPKKIHFHASLLRSPVGKVLKSAIRELALGAGRVQQQASA